MFPTATTLQIFCNPPRYSYPIPSVPIPVAIHTATTPFQPLLSAIPCRFQPLHQAELHPADFNKKKKKKRKQQG
jgi:hypothetical protein